MSPSFSGQTVLVAGGTGAFVGAVSQAFVAADATAVIVTYRREEEFDALKIAAGERGSRLAGHRVDVTDEVAISSLIETVVERHGRLDALVNCVGGFAGGINLWETEWRVFDQMMALNVRSGFALARVALPVMLRQGSGAIVNTASRAALDPAAGAAAYAASKAGAVAMINSLAVEVKDTGVRVNSVLPGMIDTPANRRAMPAADYAKWTKPEEIARVILFLCGDDAKVIHGAAIPV
jgi:NAD(P)-dependent dehydrogenase (short-subunit alcohol dehydrogenase family)